MVRGHLAATRYSTMASGRTGPRLSMPPNAIVTTHPARTSASASSGSRRLMATGKDRAMASSGGSQALTSHATYGNR